MIIQNIPQQEIPFDMTYHDDPIVEDYIIRQPPLYQVNRNNADVNRQYNIVQPNQPAYNINTDNSSDTTIRYNIIPTEAESKQSWFSKILKTFSHYGMNYEDDVIRNTYAIPADTNLLPHDSKLPIDIYSQLAQWRKKSNEDKSFFEKDLGTRREVLRKFAQQPELEDILDVMCNEAIVYDPDNAFICLPYIDTNIIESLTETAERTIKNQLDKDFYKLYMLLEWKTRAWDEFKRYLIDGVLAYEIVYDSIEHPHQIIGFIPLDPVTLTKAVENGTTYWYQYKGVTAKERKLLDAQIIYVKYQDSGVVARQSYLERLIRPFRIYRIIEQAQIIWTTTQASFKTIFTIPVGNQGKARGRQTLDSAMAAYREDVSFDSESGELKVNGKVNQPFNKEYWLPENENGAPKIETLTDDGPNLNDSDQLKYFKNELYKMSKIPPSRFDQDNAATWFGTEVSSMLRDEINFSRFVNRIRNAFAQILLKPLQIQLALSLPDLKADKRILNAISLRFVSYNQFEELMDIEVMQKRLDFIKTMQDSLTEETADGNEKPFFSSRYLAEKYLKMSNTEFELNERYKKLGFNPENVETPIKTIDEPLKAKILDEPLNKLMSEEDASGPDDKEQLHSDFDIPM